MRRPQGPARVHPCAAVLYVCLPVHNEAATVGVLLWRLRTVLGDTGRDYEVVVYDDGSTDDTAAVLAPYRRVLPLTVLGGPDAPRRGRSAATEALVRHVVAHSRYPRRDACVVLQADFTDRPESLPAFLTAFDAGADVVVGRRPPDEAQPPAERRLRRMGPWVVRPLLRIDGVDDLLGAMRLFRVAVLRDLVRARGAAPVVEAPGWAGVVELLVAAVPFARRLDVVDTPGRYDVRPRASRLDWAAELRALARYAWRARGTHTQPGAPRPRLERPAASSTHASPDTAERPARATRPSPGGAPDIAPHVGTAAPEAQRSTRPERPERPRRAERPGRTRPESQNAGTDVRQHDASATPAEHPKARHVRKPVTGDPGAASSRGIAETGLGAPEAMPAGSTPAATEPAATALPGASPADALAEPARRKKRRTRRRSRASGDAGADAGPPEPPLDDEYSAPGDVAASGAANGAPPPHPAARDETDTPDIEGNGDAPATTGGRRRKRRRSRSGGRSSGVAPLVSDASPASGDRFDVPPPGATASGESLSDLPPTA